MSAPQPAYRGDFVAWTGVCGFIGAGGRGAAVEPHAHYAIQLAIGIPAGLRVQLGRHGEWQACAAALMPSRAVHTIDVGDCGMSVVLFIEPETAVGKALAARLRGGPELLEARLVAEAATRIERAWRIDGSHEGVQAACTGLLQQLSGASAREPSDARVLAAVDYLNTKLGEPVALAEVARHVSLSPERFRHLFVEETGMALRSYVLWRRLLRVWTLLSAGETLSAAAHAAGFADSAHLSRTSRTLFGLPPSALQMRGPLSERAKQQRLHRA